MVAEAEARELPLEAETLDAAVVVALTAACPVALAILLVIQVVVTVAGSVAKAAGVLQEAASDAVWAEATPTILFKAERRLEAVAVTAEASESPRVALPAVVVVAAALEGDRGLDVVAALGRGKIMLRHMDMLLLMLDVRAAKALTIIVLGRTLRAPVGVDLAVVAYNPERHFKELAAGG